mgnify:FL=1
MPANHTNKSASVVNLEFEEGKSSENIKGVTKKYPSKAQTQ